MIWSDYQRHETKQPEKVLEFLNRMQAEAGIAPNNCRMFITGSGGSNIAPLIGAKFVQEVTADLRAVEKLHPQGNEVIQPGGQEAKIIRFKEDENTGRKKKIPTLHPSRWYAEESGGGESRSRLREVAFPQRSSGSRSDCARALRRIRRHWRGSRGHAPLQQWTSDYFHRPRCGSEHPVSHDAQ